MANFDAMLAEFDVFREAPSRSGGGGGGVADAGCSLPRQRIRARTLIRVTLRSRLPDLGLVALGGALGSIARVGVSTAIGPVDATGGFPLATLVVNVFGSFALGALIAGTTARDEVRWRRLRLLLGTGLLGGFTTYSLLAADLAASLLDERFGMAMGYAFATVTGGAIASGLGVLLGQRIARAHTRPVASEATR